MCSFNFNDPAESHILGGMILYPVLPRRPDAKKGSSYELALIFFPNAEGSLPHLLKMLAIFKKNYPHLKVRPIPTAHDALAFRITTCPLFRQSGLPWLSETIGGLYTKVLGGRPVTAFPSNTLFLWLGDPAPY